MADANASSSYATTIKYGTPVKATDRGLMSTQDLAAKYGNVDYDRDAIEGVFQGAVDAEYAAKNKEYTRSANQYYNRLATSQNAYLDAMRKQAGLQAVQSGASQGMQAANQLSGMLGMSQQTSLDATTLAQQQRALADQQAAAQSAATKEALTYANQQKLALGTLGANIYATDAQKYVGELGANSQIEVANTGASAQGYVADKGLEGTRYNADMNFKGVDLTSSRNLAGTRYASDKNLAGAQASAAAQRAAAASAAAATKYAADSNYASNKYASDAAGYQQWVSTAGTATVAALQEGQPIATVLSNLYNYAEHPQESAAAYATQPAPFKMTPGG